MKISLIVAMANNRVIGKNNKMPWHLSADLKKFKKITMGSPILMGRKTHESIGKALVGRKNIIISRNLNYQTLDCEVFHNIQTAIDSLSDVAEIFVIGGAGFYQSMLPLASTLYLTEIHQSFTGDTYFPEINPNDWQESERLRINKDPQVDFDYSFVILKRSTNNGNTLKERT